MKLAGKTALITGAGSGIGREAALALLAEGCNVTLAGRRLDALEETVRQAGPFAGNALSVSADVSDPESVRELFAASMERFGRLDLLFNNAGVTIPATPMEDVGYEDWVRVININLTGSFLCAQQAMRIMKNQSPKGGRIINNGSVAAQAPRPHSVPYGASKHAITGLTKSIILEGRDHDICCCQIDIGNAAVDRTAQKIKSMLQPDGSRKPEAQMSTDSVAETIVFIARLPLDVNVPFMTIMANRMPHYGRG